jgi:hypothetical protein
VPKTGFRPQIDGFAFANGWTYNQAETQAIEGKQPPTGKNIFSRLSSRIPWFPSTEAMNDWIAALALSCDLSKGVHGFRSLIL